MNQAHEPERRAAGHVALTVNVRLHPAGVGGRLSQLHDRTGPGPEPDPEPALQPGLPAPETVRAMLHVWVQAGATRASIEASLRRCCAEIAADGQIENALPPSWAGIGSIVAETRLIGAKRVPEGVELAFCNYPHGCRYKLRTLKAELCSALKRGGGPPLAGSSPQCCCQGAHLTA